MLRIGLEQLDLTVLYDAAIAWRVLAPAPEVRSPNVPSAQRAIGPVVIEIRRFAKLGIVPAEKDAAVMGMIIRREARDAFSRWSVHRMKAGCAGRGQSAVFWFPGE